MAFGIEGVLKAVQEVGNAVKDVGDTLDRRLTEIRGLIDRARQSVSDDIANTCTGLGNRIADAQRTAEEAKAEAAAARRDIADLRAAIEAWKAEAAAAKAAAEEARRAHEEALRARDALLRQQQEMALRRQEAEAEQGPSQEAREESAHEASAQPGDTAENETTAREEHQRHLNLLLAAAGVSAVTLTCHRDLWAFLVEQAADEQHFRVPGEVTADNGNAQVVLSGRSVIAALTALWEVRHSADPVNGDWALAHELYEAIASAVQAVKDTPRSSDGDGVAIVIDRRAPAPEPDAESGAEQEDEDGNQGDDQPPRSDGMTD